MNQRLAYLTLFIIIASNLYGSTLFSCFKAMSAWFNSQRTETARHIVSSDTQGENRTFSVLIVSDVQTPEAEERNALEVIEPHIYLLPVEVLGNIFSF